MDTGFFKEDNKSNAVIQLEETLALQKQIMNESNLQLLMSEEEEITETNQSPPFIKLPEQQDMFTIEICKLREEIKILHQQNKDLSDALIKESKTSEILRAQLDNIQKGMPANFDINSKLRTFTYHFKTNQNQRDGLSDAQNKVNSPKPIQIQEKQTSFLPFSKTFGYYQNHMFYPVNLPENLTFEQLVDKYNNQKHIIDHLTNQRNTYQNEIAGIKSVLDTYSEKYRNLIIKYKELQSAYTMSEANSNKQFHKYVEAKEEIIKLSDQVISYTNVILYFEKCRPNTTTELQWNIIKALFINAHCQKKKTSQSFCSNERNRFYHHESKSKSI